MPHATVSTTWVCVNAPQSQTPRVAGTFASEALAVAWMKVNSTGIDNRWYAVPIYTAT